MTEIDIQTLPYRQGVGICLLNRQGLVLMAERRDSPGSWQMPQGGVNKGEDPSLAVLREMKEEIGTDHARILEKYSEKLRYEFPDWLQNRRTFRGKYRGQEQEWFALLFLGEESDIDLSGAHEPENPEFIAWKWVDLSETPHLIVPFKKKIYETIATAFAPLASSLRSGTIS